MQITIISDPHIGLTRKAGATAASMLAYTQFQQQLLRSIKAEELLITGDLFASSDVTHEHLLFAWDWLRRYPKVTVLQGNHDIAKNRDKLSSLDFIGQVLPNLKVIREPEIVGEVAYVPHLANQDAFDKAIENVAETATILVTHCNFNNSFACEKDHSLNLTPEQAALFDLVISGHEHERRTVNNVVMLGSVLPCNITETGDKFYYTWDGADQLQAHLVWSSSNYIEIDWRSLEQIDYQFIRVVGEASADEAAQVIQELSDFRKKSKAFMITNSVKVGKLEIGELEDSASDLSLFDPIKALKSVLSKEHREQLEEVLGE